MIKKILKIVTISTLLLGGLSVGDDILPNLQGKIVDRAGKQRMLSQRMVKDYFYVAKGVNELNALKQLKKSFIHFKRTQRKLNDVISDSEIKNLIAFVDMNLKEFATLSKEKYTIDNGIIMLDLSESILEGSDYVVKALTKGEKSNEIINTAGKQRMLSQRIAKYYIAYQVGIKDNNTIGQMKASVKEFDDNLKYLLALKENTAQITKKLKKVAMKWAIVYKFYLNIEKGGLPKIVFSTTDKITKEMDDIVALYVPIFKK